MAMPQKSYAQLTKYYAFIHYVSRSLNPPQSVKENCEWQYAIVKVKPDRQGRIINCSILNKVSDDLKNSFGFLKGYQFPASMHINGRPVVFCVSIMNEKSACATQRLYTPSQSLGIVFADLRVQQMHQPQTLFLFDMVDVVYSSDAVR
ncbi:hypothetical protein HQ865_16975 [Mucilaginibacter mali]|uniref:Uncharacterized protein n=1 Tax=Mucilaginibacter mali TaxID=2740462 RepID=A0A7D4QD09_9SPHI|nr:hypothetical protein [Mucilaginibacter mali]QKJ31384.1 hypothetical protein HQ865_16975 [Mucilaginibacter mali]